MKGTGLTLPLFLPWEVHEEAARQPTKDRIIQVKRSIGRAYDDHVVLLVRLQSVHLLHEFCDNTTVCQGIARLPRQPRAEQGIQFVNKDDTRGEAARKREDSANELLALADVLDAYQRSVITKWFANRKIE